MYGARQVGGAGPIVLVPGGLFWTRRRAGFGFRRVVQADTHDSAGRLSSKSGPDMIISCGDLRLVGSTRHRKVSQNPHSILSRSGWWPSGSVGGVPKVAPEPSPYMVLRTDRLVALLLDGVVFQKDAPVLLYWPVGVLVVAPGLDGAMFKKMGWCSKKLAKNPHSVYYYFSDRLSFSGKQIERLHTYILRLISLLQCRLSLVAVYTYTVSFI